MRTIRTGLAALCALIAFGASIATADADDNFPTVTPQNAVKSLGHAVNQTDSLPCSTAGSSCSTAVASIKANAGLLSRRIQAGAPISPAYAASLSIDAAALARAASEPSTSQSTTIRAVQLDLAIKAAHANAMAASNSVGNDMAVLIKAKVNGTLQTGVAVDGNPCPVPDQVPSAISVQSNASLGLPVGCYVFWAVVNGRPTAKQWLAVGTNQLVQTIVVTSP